MSAGSSTPATLIRDEDGNVVGLILDGSIYRLQTETKITGTVPLPTGAATEVTLSSIDNKVPSLGQAVMANSSPVVIASDQSRIPVNTEVQIDYDTGAGTQDLSMVGIALPTDGGAVAGGTITNPIRTDPIGSTVQPIYLRDEQHNQKTQYTVFGALKTASETIVEDLRYDSVSLTTKWTITLEQGAGYETEPGGIGAKFITSLETDSRVEFFSKSKVNYVSGVGVLFKISIVLGDTGVTGNVREWGLKNKKGDGIFMRMDGTTLKLIHSNQYSETEYLASSFDVPVTVDPNGHLWYIQYPWLGVADIYIYYDNQVVHRIPYLGTSTILSLGDPDMHIHISNENVSNTSSVSLKSGCASVFIEGPGPIFGKNPDGKGTPISVSDMGNLKVGLVNVNGEAISTLDNSGSIELATHDDRVLMTLQLMLKELRLLKLMLGHASEIGFDEHE